MNNSLRTFIKNGSIILAVAAILPNPALNRFERPGAGPTLQLFAVEKEMQQDVPSTLMALKKIVYHQVEHAGYAKRKFLDIQSKSFEK